MESPRITCDIRTFFHGPKPQSQSSAAAPHLFQVHSLGSSLTNVGILVLDLGSMTWSLGFKVSDCGFMKLRALDKMVGEGAGSCDNGVEPAYGRI